MTISYHSGGRLQATSTDYNSGAGIPAVSGGWKELARTTLGSAGDTISVASLADKRYYMVLVDKQNSGEASDTFRFNNDSGSNYALRRSNNGGTDVTAGSQNILSMGTDDTYPSFSVQYLSNLSNKEKLNIYHQVNRKATGAGNAPQRVEGANKWANTSSSFNRFDMINQNTGDYASGSEVVVLGWDPDDTHTDNFWEELATTTLGVAGDDLDMTSFTAKKYLWVQMYVKPTGSMNLDLTFNNNTTTYARRGNWDGGTDSTATSEANVELAGSATTPVFCNMFIINNSANEKLGINWQNRQGTAGAGNAPDRTEQVFKWDNTSSQITRIDLNNSGTGDFDTGSFIKVWGSD